MYRIREHSYGVPLLKTCIYAPSHCLPDTRYPAPSSRTRAPVQYCDASSDLHVLHKCANEHTATRGTPPDRPALTGSYSRPNREEDHVIYIIFIQHGRLYGVALINT